ncbi:MAG: hypothetical protein JWR07_446 [Nevskia sp.]|nr:hypothetical protein [Nevskia sp.]
MTSQQALAFIQQHGIVLEAARGKAPSLAEAIAGEPLSGTWWSHPKSQEVYAATRAVRDSPDVLVCRLLGGKVTFVHRRLWPALVRAAHRFPLQALVQLRETHKPSGKHGVEELPFPRWVPESIHAEAQQLTEEEALQALSPWLS